MSNSKSALFQTNALFTCFAREEGLHQYMIKTKHIHWCDVFPNLVAEYEVLNFCLFDCSFVIQVLLIVGGGTVDVHHVAHTALHLSCLLPAKFILTMMITMSRLSNFF